MNSMMFDVAVGPLYLLLFGIPILIIAAVIVLMVISIRLIKRARAKNIEAENKPEHSDSSVEGR